MFGLEQADVGGKALRRMYRDSSQDKNYLNNDTLFMLDVLDRLPDAPADSSFSQWRAVEQRELRLPNPSSPPPLRPPPRHTAKTRPYEQHEQYEPLAVCIQPWPFSWHQ